MNKRSREISVTQTGRKQGEVLTVEITYREGGINFYNYQNEPKGFYLYVGVETREQHDGYTVTAYGLGNSGLKHFIEPAARFNAKRLASIVPDPETVEKLTAHVLEMTKAKVA